MGSMPLETLVDTAQQRDVYGNARSRLTTVKEEGGVVQTFDPSWYQDDSDVDGVQLPSPKRQRTGFACQACNMSFTEKRALARHKKTDHHRKQLGLPPDRKHACQLCGKCFTRGHDLKRHQTEQHKDAASSSGGMESSSGSSDCSTEHATSEEPPTLPQPVQVPSGPGSSSFTAIDDGPTLSPEDLSLLESAYPYVATAPDDHRFDDDVTMSGALPSEQPLDKPKQRFIAVPDDRMFFEYTESTEASESPGTSDINRKLKSPPSELPSSGLPSSALGSAGLSSSGFPSSGLPSSGLRTQVSLPDLQRPTHHPSRSIEMSWHPTLCIICGDAFEDDSDELLQHLRRHLDNFKGQYHCKHCRIDFVHEEDLAKHLLSATTEGHCGFNFPHSCTGHHPPTSAKPGLLSDYDRARLCVRLQHWEQAQLQAYIAEISDLTNSRMTKKFTRWSDVLRGGSRRNSFASFAISVNSYATAPCDTTTEGKTDIGGLQKRLQQMSLGRGAGAKVRRLVHSGSRDDLRSRTVDRSLHKAVKHNDVHKAEKLLDMGGDASIIHETEGPFIAKALWGYGQVSGLLAEHRLDEDIMGGCSVCHMATDSFDKGFNKVKALLKHGADPNQAGGLRGFPLATASWLGKADVVKQLLDYGANVHQLGGRFGNALCAAASEAGYSGHAEVIRLLVSRGAGVDSHGPEGSALTLARGRREVLVRRLMKRNNELGEQEEDPEEESRGGSLSYCDEVIRILERRDWSHVQRPSTAGAGGCREEVGNGRATKARGLKLNPTPSKQGLQFVRYWSVDS